MQALNPVQSRSSQASAVERKRADGTIKPFIGELKGWNGKAARLRGLAESLHSTQGDRVQARLECDALLTEIQRRHRDFRVAIKGEAQHSRFDDVDAAFVRLIDHLQSISDGRGNAI